MKILKNKINDSTLEMIVLEKIDVTNAQGLYNNIVSELDGITEFTLDFGGITFISSAGLRTMLDISKTMKDKNINFAISNTPDEIMDIFKMTGFDKILTFK